jgi:translation initiation factor 6
MSVLNADHFGNPFVGLYARASDSYLIAAPNCPPKMVAALSALGAKTIFCTIDRSFLVGLFCAGNKNGIVVPISICADEKRAIKKAFPDVTLGSLSGKLNAAGNNICANSHGGIANPDFSRAEIKQISDTLGVEIVPMEIVGHKTVGTCCLATEKGFVAHNRINEPEMKQLESIFKVKGANATVNMGTPFAPLGIIANSHGMVAGLRTSGFELSRIMGGLDLQ